MESSVRRLIGFILIYQLLQIIDAKVIKQSADHEPEISFANDTSLRPQVEPNGASIEEPTPSNVTFLTHM
jgi:hypothetical protein